MKNRTLVVLCFFICTWMAVNAAENYKFRTLSPDGGFYYDGVKSIEQDKDGFIWLGSDNGLNRYSYFYVLAIKPEYISDNSIWWNEF